MRRKLFLFFFFGTLSILCLFLLRFPAQAGALASNGLTLWFSKMIPALFPFMILSGLFLSTGFSNLLARLAAPVLQPVFQTTDACLFCKVCRKKCVPWPRVSVKPFKAPQSG